MTVYGWLIRLDFLLAVLLTVLVPLGLLAVAGARRAGPRGADAWREMVGYWRVASLLAINVLLLIGGSPLAFALGYLARIALPVGLFVLHEDVHDGAWDRAFRYWRGALTLYCLAGLLLSTPLLGCALRWRVAGRCQVWLEPAREFGGVLLPFLGPAAATAIGTAAAAAWGLGMAWWAVRALRNRTA